MSLGRCGSKRGSLPASSPLTVSVAPSHLRSMTLPSALFPRQIRPLVVDADARYGSTTRQRGRSLSPDSTMPPPNSWATSSKTSRAGEDFKSRHGPLVGPLRRSQIPLPHHMPTLSGSGQGPDSLSVAVSNSWGPLFCFCSLAAAHSLRFCSPSSPRSFRGSGPPLPASGSPDVDDAGTMQM